MSSLRQQVTRCKPSVVKITSIIGKNPDGTYIASLGSGFIVHESGYVVTNNHVIANPNAQSNFVQFFDRTRKPVLSIVHRDQFYDFAVLRIEEGNYNKLSLGNYNDIEEGDDIFFCGYPLHSDFHVVQKGMVSSKSMERNIDKIQLDASVNVGNSGGPLLSMDERVVGIITEKAGGIDKKMKDISDFILNASTIFTLDWKLASGQTIKVDPTKELAKVISIIHDYTNVGIGFAYSIDYASNTLRNLKLI